MQSDGGEFVLRMFVSEHSSIAQWRTGLVLLFVNTIYFTLRIMREMVFSMNNFFSDCFSQEAMGKCYSTNTILMKYEFTLSLGSVRCLFIFYKFTLLLDRESN